MQLLIRLRSPQCSLPDGFFPSLRALFSLSFGSFGERRARSPFPLPRRSGMPRIPLASSNSPSFRGEKSAAYSECVSFNYSGTPVPRNWPYRDGKHDDDDDVGGGDRVWILPARRSREPILRSANTIPSPFPAILRMVVAYLRKNFLTILAGGPPSFHVRSVPPAIFDGIRR